uniref:Uncharacterized protein n=1 Tax=Timema cristinae TaxID=61476 RepID=A0A7R9CNB2_TIMCR|nr:unnamed protein product [Timema cristinae]
MDHYKRLQSKGYARPSYWFETGSEPLSPLTFGQLIEWAAEEYADREALVSVYEDLRLTFKEAKEKEFSSGPLALYAIALNTELPTCDPMPKVTIKSYFKAEFVMYVRKSVCVSERARPGVVCGCGGGAVGGGDLSSHAKLIMPQAVGKGALP